MRYICYGAFSTAASIVGVIVLFTGGPAIAFEKVQAEVKKVDAVTYVDTQVAKTALPVRISYERKPTSPTDALPIKRTFDRFDLKPVLTDDQFALDPPKGFTEGIFGFVKPVVPAKK